MAFENKGAMAATVVVAASDSLNKAAANYVCDGVADNVEIQAAINACPENGKVLILDGILNTTATINILKTLEFECIAKIKPAAGVDAIKLGDNDDDAFSSVIKLGEITGVGKATAGKGIVINNASYCSISWQSISYCDVGIEVDALVSGAENRFYGGAIYRCTIGFSFSNAAIIMQGNWILASILECDTCLSWAAGGHSNRTTFMGVVDAAGVGVNRDFYDLVGGNLLLPYYHRNANSTLPGNDILLGPLGANLGANPWLGFFGASLTVQTISGGVITVTSSFSNVDTEGAAATDDLDTINGGQQGQILTIRAASSSRDVVVKHATGNIHLNGNIDYTLAHGYQTLTLIRVSTLWLEIGRGTASS